MWIELLIKCSAIYSIYSKPSTKWTYQCISANTHKDFLDSLMTGISLMRHSSDRSYVLKSKSSCSCFDISNTKTSADH